MRIGYITQPQAGVQGAIRRRSARQEGSDAQVTGRRARIEIDGVPEWVDVDPTGGTLLTRDGTELAADAATFLAPAEPTKILAVHLTYRSRLEEYRAKTPAEPSYFMKPPTTLNGHRGVLRRPAGARFLNYEGELAVVVDRPMKGVGIDEALDYVRGYAVANDAGLHDFRHADRGSMLRVKGQDGFLPLGPWLTPASDFDPTAYELITRVNDRIVQQATADDLIWGVAYQLADLSRLITLEAGDVLLTGTPANSRPLEIGDTVSVEISGLGRIENTVVEWDVDLAGPGEQLEVSANTLHVALAMPEDEAERRAAALAGGPDAA